MHWEQPSPLNGWRELPAETKRESHNQRPHFRSLKGIKGGRKPTYEAKPFHNIIYIIRRKESGVLSHLCYRIESLQIGEARKIAVGRGERRAVFDGERGQMSVHHERAHRLSF